MMLLPWLAGILLLLMAILLEEAAVWFVRNVPGAAERGTEEPEGRAMAVSAGQSGLLARLLEGAAFVLLVTAAMRHSSVWAGLAGVVLLVVWTVGASVVTAMRWHEPLARAGRVVFRPMRGAGTPLGWLPRQFGRIPGLGKPLSSPQRLAEWNHEIRWLRGGEGEGEEGRMVATLREFGESRAEDVLVPREEVVGVSAETSRDEILALVQREGFSRYPVFRESLDTVVGVLHVFDLLTAGPDTRAEDLAREPFLTNDTKLVSVLLRELQVTYNQMAVVLDEYGGTAGIVTVEDLLEELVGEIRDELDLEEGDALRRLEPGVYWVDAAMRLEDLNEALKLGLETGDYDTVAGLLLDRLERIPMPGERIREGGAWIEVLSAEPQRINSVKVTVPDRVGDRSPAD